MPHGGKPDFKSIYAFVLFFSLFFCTSLTLAWAAETPDSKPSTQDLESLVRTIEDPDRREDLLDQLRTLMDAQKTREEAAKAPVKTEAESRGAYLSELLFARFEDTMERITTSARETGAVLSKTPALLRNAKEHLNQVENRRAILRLLGVALGAFVISLIMRFLIQSRMPKSLPSDSRRSRRVALSGAAGILRMLPPGLALLALFLLFRVVPCPAMGRALVFQLFIVLFGYRVVMETVRALLSPDEPGLRILGIRDESAYYYWVWFRRFAIYTAFYFLTVGILALTRFPETPLMFIRNLLLLVFPCMITAFVLQIAGDLRKKSNEVSEEEKPGKPVHGKGTRAAVRIIPALSIFYAWAFFLVLIVSLEEGFGFIWTATLGTAVTIPALIGALHLLDWLFDKLFAVHERIKARVPGIEERTDRYLAIVRKISAGVIVFIAAGVVGEFWGIPVGSFVVSRIGSVILARVVAIGITLGVVITLLQSSRVLSVYLLREGAGRVVTQKTKTLVPILRTAFNIGAVFVGGIVILGRLGVDTTPILAGAGIVGLAVGFGAQTLIKDLINGLFILFEESVRVGDWAQVGNNNGEVESVGLRTLRLRDLHGNVHVIPNSSIDSVTNFSKEFSRSVMDIGVAYREDIDEVIAVLKELGEELRNDPEYQSIILGPLEVFGLDRFEDSAIIVRIRFVTKPLRQWGVKREFYRRMKRVFDERGIEIPFPHRTVYMGEPKKGPAPPVHVRVDGQAREVEALDESLARPSTDRDEDSGGS